MTFVLAALIVMIGAAPAAAGPTPTRIVSLAPSVTETVVALGAGDRLVGISGAGSLPPGVAPARIGGWYDLNVEKIVTLSPDLIVGVAEQQGALARLEKLSIPTMILDQTGGLDRIVDSVVALGDRIGEGERGRVLADRMNRRIASLQAGNVGVPPRILVVVGKRVATDGVKGLFVAGPATFYRQLVELAGGVNACATPGAAFPSVSAEGFALMAPDLVIDIVAQATDLAETDPAVWDRWRRVTGGDFAVVVVDGGESLVPGPRILDFAERLAGIVQEWRRR
jgi:iron complex transport system substrate-binding protein